ncbi:hypothetical protein AB4Y32_16295 [Paraburkholderia phymatum]|uniref:Uncharacterized protein n=1 Tax=Paraburkholderia phymatum TaxID=148447 RepID=A0ACC6U144_9BURK
MLDDDGYPTEEALKRIADWPWRDALGMLAFVRDLWRYPNFWTQEGGRLSVSTGGWSGNELLIAAMQRNIGFWKLCWHQSTRGGHYTFDLSRVRGMEGEG